MKSIPCDDEQWFQVLRYASTILSEAHLRAELDEILVWSNANLNDNPETKLHGNAHGECKLLMHVREELRSHFPDTPNDAQASVIISSTEPPCLGCRLFFKAHNQWMGHQVQPQLSAILTLGLSSKHPIWFMPDNLESRLAGAFVLNCCTMIVYALWSKRRAAESRIRAAMYAGRSESMNDPLEELVSGDEDRDEEEGTGDDEESGDEEDQEAEGSQGAGDEELA